MTKSHDEWLQLWCWTLSDEYVLCCKTSKCNGCWVAQTKHNNVESSIIPQRVRDVPLISTFTLQFPHGFRLSFLDTQGEKPVLSCSIWCERVENKRIRPTWPWWLSPQITQQLVCRCMNNQNNLNYIVLSFIKPTPWEMYKR